MTAMMQHKPAAGKRKAKNPKKTMKRLIAYITGKYKGLFAMVLVTILLSSIASVASSLFLKVLIDDYIKPLLLLDNPLFAELFKIIVIMGIIYLIGVISSLLYSRAMVVIAQGVLKDIRDQMFAHMQALPIKYFDTHPFGDIMSRYTNDTDTLRQMIAQSLAQMFSALVTVAAVFIAMLFTNWQLTVLVVMSMALMLKISAKIAGKSAKYFILQQQSLGTTNGFIEEMINGQKVIKVFCHEADAKEDFAKLNDQLCDNATKANLYANILMPIMVNLGNMQYVLVAVCGGGLAISGIGGLTVGGIAAFLQLSKSFTMTISRMAQQINSVIMALAGAERIFELMDEPIEEDPGTVTLVNARYQGDTLSETEERTGIWAWKQLQQDGSALYTKVCGDVRFFDVQFSYDGKNTILKDVSLFAKPGQKLAFVGATGAGKTTITNLINRFYDIEQGRITYDGIDTKKIKKSDLRRSLGMVLQDTNLFTGTVMDNIRYGKLDATDQEVYDAARRANADTFISLLPQGYNTLLNGSGDDLSQGQRQLLSIARAAVSDPPVLILDEATSSIDTRTESIVQRGMDALMHGRTVFVIAHRLATVQNADAIMVLEQGQIIERGNHQNLLEQQGKYYQLYSGAFELE